jgi:small subunit ribosomal protein S8
MNVTDPIGDLLARIRNAQQRGKSKVTTPASKLRERVLEVLQQEGYIRGFSVAQHEGGKAEIEIELKYFDGEPVIKNIKRVSKPGRRVYASVETLPVVYRGSASRSCRRRRASCRIPRRGPTMSAVRCSARSSRIGARTSRMNVKD